MQNKFQKSILLDQKYELNTSVNYNLILRNKSVFLKSALSEGECVTLASFKISMIIAKYQKPFSDGEFVKQNVFWKVGQHYILIIIIKIQL